MSIKVLLVDNHLIVSHGLRLFLNSQADIEIVGVANNGKDALEQINEVKPDIVLMDLMMDLRVPAMNGIETTMRIKETNPNIKVIVLTSYLDQEHVLPALRAGAVGYQLKDIELDELVNTIRAAYRGQTRLHPVATNLLLSSIVLDEDLVEKKDNMSELTKREIEVLYQLTLGKSNKEISSELFITETTVKTHVSNILSKLELNDRTQAALFAVKNELFEKN